MNTKAPAAPTDPGRPPAPDPFAAAAALVLARQWREGERAMQAILRDDPRDARAWDALGYIAYNRQEYAVARAQFRRALGLDPDSAAYLCHLGSACRALGEPEEAVKHYRRALELAPEDTTALGNLGNALRQMGQLNEACISYGRAVALEPKSVSARLNLAAALTDSKLYRRAMLQARQALLLDPRSAAVHKTLGIIMLAEHDYEGARHAFATACKLEAGDHDLHHNYGLALQALGRMDEAAEQYRLAVAAKPDATATRRALGGIRRQRNVDEELRELEMLLLGQGIGESERAELHFGLAKLYDDLGRYDDAFAALQAGNQIVHRKLRYSAEQNRAGTDELIKIFPRGFFETRAGFGLPTEQPVFIVGMPRSGTTLCEQILASHPKVFGAGEMLTISNMATALPQQVAGATGAGQALARLSAAQSRELAEAYLAEVRRLGGTAERTTDKMPFNFRWLGLIALMFPNARIIHCLRDPLDTSLSCYFARFRDKLDFAFNLLDIGRYYLDYRRLMAHWRAVLPLRMMELRYEELVADQEGRSREIVAFCGLDWDDRCLEFYRSERAVATASSWQVRQPIYSTSVGRWRHYERQLAPLVALLARSTGAAG